MDVSCDSKFMEDVMKRVGKALQKACDWLLFGTPIFLYLDKTGDHRIQETVNKYVKALKD